MLVSHLALALIALASEVLARDSRPSTTCSTKYGPNTMRRVPTYSSSTTKTLTRTRCTIQKIASTVTPDRETETVQVTEIATATVTADPGVQTATTTVVGKRPLHLQSRVRVILMFMMSRYFHHYIHQLALRRNGDQHDHGNKHLLRLKHDRSNSLRLHPHKPRSQL